MHLANKQNSKHTQECIDCSPNDQTASSGPEHHTKWSNLDQNENGNKLKIFNISSFSQFFWLMDLSIFYCPTGQETHVALAKPHQMWKHHVLSKNHKKSNKEFYHSSIEVGNNLNWMFHRKQHWIFLLNCLKRQHENIAESNLAGHWTNRQQKLYAEILLCFLKIGFWWILVLNTKRFIYNTYI